MLFTKGWQIFNIYSNMSLIIFTQPTFTKQKNYFLPQDSRVTLGRMDRARKTILYVHLLYLQLNLQTLWGQPNLLGLQGKHQVKCYMHQCLFKRKKKDIEKSKTLGISPIYVQISSYFSSYETMYTLLNSSKPQIPHLKHNILLSFQCHLSQINGLHPDPGITSFPLVPQD